MTTSFHSSIAVTTKEFAISQQLSGVAEHVLLRRVPTRWLQQLVVFQRILEQYPALVVHFRADNLANITDRKGRAISIANGLKDSSTKAELTFLIYALKITDVFERRLQSGTLLISVLFDCMMDLLRSILLQFIQPDVIKSAVDSGKLWDLDLQRKDQVEDNQLGIGEDTRIHLRDPGRKPEQNALFFLKVRTFYKNLAAYLMKELPFRKFILRRMQILNPAKLQDEESPDLAVALAKQLPTIVSRDELDPLRQEVQQLRLQGPSAVESPTPTVFWQQVAAQKDIFGESAYPLLTKLSQAAMTFFHANADPERAIGKSSDIDDDSKRNSMADSTRLAHLRICSFLCSTKQSCIDVHINQNLLELGIEARAKYAAYQAEKRKQKAQETAKQAAVEREAKLVEAARQEKKRLEKATKIREREQSANNLEQAANQKVAEAEMALQKIAERLRQAQLERDASQKAKQAVDRDRQLLEQRAQETALKRGSWTQSEPNNADDREGACASKKSRV